MTKGQDSAATGAECGCIAEIDKHLAEYNARIMVSLFGPPRAFVETHTEKKIRGKKTPLVYASFCPFCGVKYPAAKKDSLNG